MVQAHKGIECDLMVLYNFKTPQDDVKVVPLESMTSRRVETIVQLSFIKYNRMIEHGCNKNYILDHQTTILLSISIFSFANRNEVLFLLQH